MNFEIKKEIFDPEAIREKLEKIKADFIEAYQQDDMYFNVENGFLKIRHSGDEPARLIQYFKNFSTGGMISNYAMVSIRKTDQISAMLMRTHSIRAHVQKKREIWYWDSIHIYIDEVNGVGHFIKFVAQDSDENIPAKITEQVNRLIFKLKLDRSENIHASYCELAEMKHRDKNK